MDKTFRQYLLLEKVITYIKKIAHIIVKPIGTFFIHSESKILLILIKMSIRFLITANNIHVYIYYIVKPIYFHYAQNPKKLSP